MKTIDSIKKGEQIFSTYGLINNEELLRRYGLDTPTQYMYVY